MPDNSPVTFIHFTVCLISCFNKKPDIIKFEEEIYINKITKRTWNNWINESRLLKKEDYLKLYGKDNYSRPPSDSDYKAIAGIVSHHTLIAPLLIKYFEELKSQNILPSNIIIIGPDHYSRSKQTIAICNGVFKWNDSVLRCNKKIVKDWQDKLGLEWDNYPFYFEHSIKTIIPFICSYFTDTKVIPIIIRKDCSLKKAKELSKIIRNYIKGKESKVFIFISIDFSHSLSIDATNAADKDSLDIIFNMPQGYPFRLNCDSKKSFYIVNEALLNYKKEVQILFHTNSQDYLNKQLEDITSYFGNIIYLKMINK